MRIIAIDPGPVTNGLVLLSTSDPQWGRRAPPRVVISDAAMSVDDMISAIGSHEVDLVVCEWLTTYGAAIGASVLDTARVIGRIEQTTYEMRAKLGLLTRPEVGLELCQSRRAKKSELRAALLALYPPAGGGKTPEVGTMRAPGPLYGVRSHAWDALAVGVAWLQRQHAGA